MTVSRNAGKNTVTLPTAFSNTNYCMSIFLSGYTSSSDPASVYSIYLERTSNSTFTHHFGSNKPRQLIAVGY